MRRIVTVIVEVNCSFATAKASLWIIDGDATADEEGPYPEDDPRAFRLLGPHDLEIVRELEQRTKELFVFLGFDVRTDTIADD